MLMQSGVYKSLAAIALITAAEKVLAVLDGESVPIGVGSPGHQSDERNPPDGVSDTLNGDAFSTL
ncbi:MAG: hypothetical protein WDN06_21300 [Asticcacaulis sp.]